MTGQRKGVWLHSTQPPIQVDFDHVYFAFASGRLSYDCVECKVQCCRGCGYLVRTGHGFRDHAKDRPCLQFFMEYAANGPGPLYSVRNCPPACFFLTSDGLCGLQLERGYEAKPETCRLFPFNALYRVGGYLVVAPHERLCPLEVVPLGSASHQSRHEELFEAMSYHGIGAAIPRFTAVGRSVESMIELERRIVGLSERYLDFNRYSDYAAVQVASLAGAGDAAMPAPGVATESHAGMAAFVDMLAEVLGTSASLIDPPDNSLVMTTVALTPALRSALLFRGVSMKGATLTDVERIPHFLVALHAFAALARAAGMARVTYQTLASLVQPLEPLLRVLAFVDCPVSWKREAAVDLRVRENESFQGPFIRIAKALLPSRQSRAGMTLGQVLCDNNPFEGLDRMAFLKSVARRLAGRITSRITANRQPRRFRVVFQQWLLTHLKEDFLVKASRHAARKAVAAQQQPVPSQ